MSAKANRAAIAAIKAKLETAHEPVKIPILPWIFAHRLGKWKPHESVATASARALGYEGERGSGLMAQEMRLQPDKFQARYWATYGRLLDDAGIDFDTVTPADIKALVERWRSELPEGMPKPD